MKNKGTRFIAEMGIFIALGLVFDIVAKPIGDAIWPNGGSISIAMVPIFIMSFRYGLKGGLFSGIAIGSIQMLWSGNGIVGWAQALLDYTVAYGLVGLAGVLSKTVYKNKDNIRSVIYALIAILICGLLRTFAHILSGVLFWSQDLFDEGIALTLIWIGSATYNLAYMAPSIILSMIVMTVLITKYYHLVEYVDLNPKNKMSSQ
ncbi:MAG: energy-coupled thiamine transporter ThiT [Bacilli bacterium]